MGDYVPPPWSVQVFVAKAMTSAVDHHRRACRMAFAELMQEGAPR